MLYVLDRARNEAAGGPPRGVGAALSDLIDDLAPDDPTGDLRRRVDFSLNAAYELLLDCRDGRATDSAMERAAEQVDEAIATLQRFRRRFD